MEATMKKITGFYLGVGMLALAVLVRPCCIHSSQAAATPVLCPAAGDMDAIQKDVDALTVEMNNASQQTTDKKTLAEMMKMEEHLALISQRLKKVHDKMDTRDGGVMASVPAEGSTPAALKKQ
jgi:hypothetical protein